MYSSKRTLLLIALIALLGVGIVYLLRPNSYISTKLNKTLEKTQQSKKTVLIATGDVVMGRSVNAQGTRYKDTRWAFKNISSLLKSGDITLINLETPLLQSCPVTDTGMVFCSRKENIDGIIEAGVDVASVANNHFSDYGLRGIDETVKLLNDKNILISGISDQPVYKTVNDIKFSFLAYNDVGVMPGIAQANEKDIAEQVKTAKENSDVVVVSFHWGVEYTATPTQRQVDLAHLAIDNGADLIIGNHPHWVQTDEYYKGKYIKYAHGNTIFDQMWSEETKKGVIGKYTFEGKNLVSVEFIPIYIRDYGQPVLATGTKI